MMYALLQTATKTFLEAESRARRRIVMSLCTICVFGAGSIALLPATIESGLMDSFVRFDDARQEDPMRVAHAGDAAAETEAMREKNQERAKKLLLFAQQETNPSDIATTITHIRRVLLRRAEIQVTSITYSGTQYVISGVSKTRAALLESAAAFKKDAAFSKAEYPLSNLTGKDGEFPFTFTLVRSGGAFSLTQ